MLLYNSKILSDFYDKDEILKCVKKTYNFKFSNNTTYGLGGGAKVAYYPKNLIEAKAVYDHVKESGGRFVIIGNGSNILASDNFFDGSVISTKRLKGIIKIDKNTIFCLAGTSVNELLNYCKKRNLGGLEYLAGIPASIGGIVLMNGGAGGKFIESNVLCVKLYNGKISNFNCEMCHFTYKHSTMRDINSLILGVFLSVLPNDSQIIQKRINHYLKMRSGQPKGKSCGCVFKNVGNLSAGKLIDEAGLKGKSCGKVYVSDRHANFIINGGGTADDVRSLIKLVKDEVFKKFGILLDEEVIYIGDFNDFNG
jgi:UDP-N-acetylmuramate dehydrogenase